MLKLGVNIDHVATLREARYKGLHRGEPDPIEAALVCEAAGDVAWKQLAPDSMHVPVDQVVAAVQAA